MIEEKTFWERHPWATLWLGGFGLGLGTIILFMAILGLFN